MEDALVGAGMSEAYTWSLAGSDPNPNAIRLPSPMTSDQAILRTTIVPGLVDAARTGIDAGAEHVALFEIARVYLPSGEQLPDEHWRVAGVMQGGYEDVKGVVETLYDTLALELRVERGSHELLHPGKAAVTDAGWLGELHPTLLEGTWGAFELDLATIFAAVPDLIVYEDVLTYPAALQDIAVAVDEDVEVGALVDAAHEAAGELLREARVFDVYRGEQVGVGPKVRRDPSRRSSRRSARSRRTRRARSAAGSSRRSPSASEPSYVRSQTDRPRAAYTPPMSKLVVVALLLAAAALLGATRGSAGPVQATKLIGAVGPEFTISLTDAQGNRVTKLDPGAYEIEVTDRSDFHNFHLQGPGVNEALGRRVHGSGDVARDVEGRELHVRLRRASVVDAGNVHGGHAADDQPAASGWWRDRHRQDEGSPHIGARVHDHVEDRGREDREVDEDRDVHGRRPRPRAHARRARRRPGLQPPDDTAHLYGHADLEGEARPHRHVPVPLRPSCRERHEGLREDNSLAQDRNPLRRGFRSRKHP